MKTTKDFVATAYIVHKDKVLLIFHKKLQKWLPVGGHIEKDELPEDALKREIKEETGLDIQIIGKCDKNGDDKQVKMLITPNHIQLENISEGHQHIDLIYFTKPTSNENEEINIVGEGWEKFKWFTIEELRNTKEINDNCKHFSIKAIKVAK